VLTIPGFGTVVSQCSGGGGAAYGTLQFQNTTKDALRAYPGPYNGVIDPGGFAFLVEAGNPTAQPNNGTSTVTLQDPTTQAVVKITGYVNVASTEPCHFMAEAINGTAQPAG
jgi:hypothetical protein